MSVHTVCNRMEEDAMDALCTIEFSIDTDTLREVETIFSTLNLTLDQAIEIFLREAILRQGLPFAL